MESQPNDRDDAPAVRSPLPRLSISPQATTTSYASPLTSSSSPAPQGHVLRRSVTVDDANPPLRTRRPVSMISLPSSDAGGADSPSTSRLRRRSATLSEFSFTDAHRSFRDGTDNILNPRVAEQQDEGSSILSSLPLAFALLPALFGIFFEGGSAIITDVMLLGLVFIFLRYTVVQPWQWYSSAQQVRIKQEAVLDHVLDDESDTEGPNKMSASVGTLGEVPEEGPQDGGSEKNHGTQTDGPSYHDDHESAGAHRTRAQQAAINELYIHEILALVSCFVSPIIGGFLLHATRSQLSRPHEGMLSNLNISVFLLASELRPISHGLTLIKARALYLQRVVQATPVPRSIISQMDLMSARIAELELRAEAREAATAAALASVSRNGGTTSSKQEAVLVREVRNAVQPEIDALNRAVRRYEKKATVLALQTESRLHALDTRLNDAIALAAVAAKQSHRQQWGLAAFMAWTIDWVVTIVTLPYHVVMFIVMWPFKMIAGYCFKSGRQPSNRDGRTGRSGRHSSHSGVRGARTGSGSDGKADRERYRDRMPSRLSRRYSP